MNKALRLGAIGSLVLLCLINLTNYVDRYLVVALAPLIRKDLDLTDTEQGLLFFSFVIVYALASPFCGYLADRVARRSVIGSAVGLWSIATALASRAPSFGVLFGLRGAVGIGEAGYNAAGQALLTDLFPPERRNRVLALFNAAVPVGSAIGFLLGGLLPTLVVFGARMGWRGACLWVGVPGLILAAAAFLLPTPVPDDGAKSESGHGHGHGGGVGPRAPLSGGPWVSKADQPGAIAVYVNFLKDRVYLTNALGYAMQAFALGGLSTWAPDFLMRTHHLDHAQAEMYAGGIVVVAGAFGTLLGAVLADAFARGNLIRSYGIVTGAGYLLAGPLLAIGLFLPFEAALVLLFLAMVGTFLGTGPTNAICTERAPAAHRAAGFALLVFLIHVLGDASSPVLIGKTSTLIQGTGVAEGPALQRALLLACVALVVGGLFMMLCAFFAHREGGQPGSAASAPGGLPKTEGEPAKG